MANLENALASVGQRQRVDEIRTESTGFRRVIASIVELEGEAAAQQLDSSWTPISPSELAGASATPSGTGNPHGFSGLGDSFDFIRGHPIA